MKELKDMSLEELWELFPIILEEYNPEYEIWYKEECAAISNSLKNHDIFRINHIGSTSVEGMVSKPTVDILLEFPKGYDKGSIVRTLQKEGWMVMAEDDRKQTVDMNKGYTSEGFAEKVYHLHIRSIGDHGELYFRDHLRKHLDTAREYEQLKLTLKDRFEHDRDAYTMAKTEFVERYTAEARIEFKGRYDPGNTQDQDFRINNP